VDAVRAIQTGSLRPTKERRRSWRPSKAAARFWRAESPEVSCRSNAVRRKREGGKEGKKASTVNRYHGRSESRLSPSSFEPGKKGEKEAQRARVVFSLSPQTLNCRLIRRATKRYRKKKKKGKKKKRSSFHVGFSDPDAREKKSSRRRAPRSAGGPSEEHWSFQRKEGERRGRGEHCFHLAPRAKIAFPAVERTAPLRRDDSDS